MGGLSVSLLSGKILSVICEFWSGGKRSSGSFGEVKERGLMDVQ